jgi:hypothetical protein
MLRYSRIVPSLPPPPGPLSILQAFSQLDHTKEHSGLSSLSQGNYSKAFPALFPKTVYRQTQV